MWNHSGYMNLSNHQMLLFVLKRQGRGQDHTAATGSLATTLLAEEYADYEVTMTGTCQVKLKVSLRQRGDPVPQMPVDPVPQSANPAVYAVWQSDGATAPPPMEGYAGQVINRF